MLSGLGSQYIQPQMKAFTDGTRLDYSGYMNRMSTVLTKNEITAISDWLATLTSKKVTNIIEVSKVPKSYLDETRMWLKVLLKEWKISQVEFFGYHCSLFFTKCLEGRTETVPLVAYGFILLMCSVKSSFLRLSVCADR